ncbi:MAG: redoxin domain-containing protein [Planctomycetota bacterium]
MTNRTGLLAAVFVCFLGWASIARAQSVATPYLLQMIRDDAVHKELELTPQQIDSTLTALRPIDAQWWPSRILPADRQASVLPELETSLQTALSAIFTPKQINRLAQLRRQAAGTRMLTQADVIDALEITDQQQQSLSDTYAETDQTVKSVRSKLQKQSISSTAANADLRDAQATERSSVANILTDTQRRRLALVTGATFDFSKVKRTYPMAPEFVNDNAQWIGTNATTPRMEDYRGNVTVVFFYAFQCINCQRNFVHYRQWHDELAEQGVQIVGIQTPETSAERDAQRVAAAYQSDQFDFPVLFDRSSDNWKAWGNTMWPTTYLIDKDGFIRRWWQGEMDWKDTGGHLQMRQTIVDLLSESSRHS